MTPRLRRGRSQDPNGGQFLGLPRACRERPRRRAAKRDNKFSPPNVDGHATLPDGVMQEEAILHPECCAAIDRHYSTTSSAVARRGVGISRPRALAVFVLTT